MAEELTCVAEDMPLDIYIDTEQEARTYPPPAAVAAASHVQGMAQYEQMYEQSVTDPEAFWTPLARKYLHWHRDWDKFCEYNFDVNKGPISIKWMIGGQTNVCYSVLDKQVQAGFGEKVAFYWEGNDPDDSSSVTYAQLLEDVCKAANILKARGVKKGDRVAIYLPMIPSLPVVMLACARIGAIHSIIFGGFSAEALAARILDAGAKVIITADGTFRGTKLIPLKQITDAALRICAQKNHAVSCCICVRHLQPSPSSGVPEGECVVAGKRPYSIPNFSWNTEIDEWYETLMDGAEKECECEWLDTEHPLFMLYTSGSTGTPKGVVHTQAGYLLYAATTFHYDFNHDAKNDVYWCTADIGWITGHSYVTYGPLANGATSVMFEGLPTHPDPGRFWAVCAKYKVTKFYTAPTAIRALMKHGANFVKKHDRSSLSVLGTVGEPINPEAWRWYYEVVGETRAAIVDTYWQTETGGHVITSLPGCTPTKPGSATLPFFGVKPVVLNEDGKELVGEAQGYLAFSQPWPGIMRTVYENHARFQTTYFGKFPGYYCTGDGCRRDSDGYFWITGRVDDMMNVSGHLLSTAEIESALVEHKSCAEAAVVATAHEIKGQTPYCFVTLRNGYVFSEDLVRELKAQVRKKIGPVAVPEFIQEAPGLPKTRSGKIMRRVLRVVASGNNISELGDTSTLADPAVVDQLYDNRSTRY